LNKLLQKYGDEIQDILAEFPSDRLGRHSAVMPIMYLAQRENGYINKDAIAEIAEICDITTTEVAQMIGFYTLYHDKPSGKYRIQVCNDLPCALHGADEFLESLCENLGVKVGETTADGKIVIETVMCVAGCHHAPLFQVQSPDGIEYHEDQTVESALEVIKKLREE
jgi:NADH-quinone oxidoreductase subunit E